MKVRRVSFLTHKPSERIVSSPRSKNPAFAWSLSNNQIERDDDVVFGRRGMKAMSIATTTSSNFRPWSEEPSARPDRMKIRARIGGLHCSLCTGTIEKALGRMSGVDKVAVSLTHEQALVEYDPQIAHPEELLGTLRDIGYTIHDPRKLRPYEDEERDLVQEGNRFVTAVALSVAAIPIIANPSESWIGVLPAIVCLSLCALVFLVLRPKGP